MSKNSTDTGCIIVTNPRGQKYRRAGLTFAPGKNKLPTADINEQQLKTLSADPHISVQTRQASTQPSPQSSLDNGRVDSTVAIEVDLAGIDESLHPILAIMLEQRFAKKPTVDELEYQVPGIDAGEVLTIKPSAEQRNAAWKVFSHAVKQGQSS
ncbi:hypothetical protein H5119_13665 [Pseudoalteromonas sp. SG45-5]|uniref:HI1506-related protein n=1 Tax=unclassified Pseudoalteromonas TaxID=194690 RepID=UPI0015FD4E56|nr:MULTISPECIES: HI1506-related protein [unclassified Pseudoalteromonas]MBB1386573.1 hypothetical protein [Pseudoalteromonas sp. SG45-5]MBB1394611.1 hypothetical protein [Pseudoalteromonas sp. SG44-4]MBB1447560.1 hypothetical protein [Pseudoalteromonas sp. SG41-6]